MKNQNLKHISVNIMEKLVAEEVARQLKRCPDNISRYINSVEVATFALNRLPPLYASCHKGFNKQKLKGKSEHIVQITKAVRQGFAAVKKDVLRDSTPLHLEDKPNSEITQNQKLQEAEQALAELAQFFPNKEMSWKDLVEAIKPLLNDSNNLFSTALQIKSTKKNHSGSSNLWNEYSYRR